MSSDDKEREPEDHAQQIEESKEYRDAWDRPQDDYIQKVEAPNPWPDPPNQNDKKPEKT
jgi:hypothetical protein